MSDGEENVHNQTHGHHDDSVGGERERELPHQLVVDVFQVPPPSSAPAPLSSRGSRASPAAYARCALRQHAASLLIGGGFVINVVVALHQPLMMDILWVANLVVEKPGQYEADGGRARTADKGENTVEAAYRQRGSVRQGQDDGREEGKSGIGHGRAAAVVTPRHGRGVQ